MRTSIPFLVGCWLVTAGLAGAQEAVWRDKMGKALMTLQQGHPAEAMNLAEISLKAAEKTFGPSHPNTARSLSLCGQISRTLNKLPEAESFHKRALAIDERNLSGDRNLLAADLYYLGEIYWTQKKLTDAETHFTRAIGIWDGLLEKKSPLILPCLDALTEVCSQLGKTAIAEQYGKRAAKLRTAMPGTPTAGGVREAAYYTNQADHAREKGDLKSAEELYRKALVAEEKVSGPMHPNVAAVLNNIASICCAQERYEEAEPLYKRCLEIAEKNHALNPQALPVVLENYINLLRHMQREKEAQQLEQRLAKLNPR
jgi:tetratricopeptide (TPR) repeat protein